MLLWHLGATLWLFRWIFKDPKVDVRFLLAGAVLPDLVDVTVGTVVLADSHAIGELWLHTLVTPTVYMIGVLLLTRRGRRRRAFMALGVGWLFHILLDGMWTDPEVFFWPFFGWELPTGETPFWPLAWERALADPWRWLLEAVGMAYLVLLWFATGVNRKERREEFFRSGRLPGRMAQDA